jgi:MFS family permease
LKPFLPDDLEEDMTEQTNRQRRAADSITAPLRYTVFRRIWLASLLSNLGLLIQGVGAAWAMTQMAASADKVALVQTALMLPIMLISMPAGAIADMYDRRIVTLVSLMIVRPHDPGRAQAYHPRDAAGLLLRRWQWQCAVRTSLAVLGQRASAA